MVPSTSSSPRRRTAPRAIILRPRWAMRRSSPPSPRVTKGISKIPFPPKCQGIVGDLIKNLLKNEPSERLPMRPGGVNTLKSHKWFEGFDWDAMFAFTLEAPYKPVVKSKKDLANFSARKEDMPKQLEYHDPCTGWDKDFASA
mmetsp:Transcript_98262/g.276319  ORF Transcript_98262/g.276319 Transcript_98262/m.276319 type:complete len:143 (-) Transcript_98262:55-483(-)